VFKTDSKTQQLTKENLEKDKYRENYNNSEYLKLQDQIMTYRPKLTFFNEDMQSNELNKIKKYNLNFNSNELDSSNFVFFYNDEVKECVNEITFKYDQIKEVKNQYEEFKKKINLQSLKSQRTFKRKFKENSFKTISKFIK
jgi:hypothetical protein